VFHDKIIFGNVRLKLYEIIISPGIYTILELGRCFEINCGYFDQSGTDVDVK
jgi:hypothetical protein